ncbi:hypothetical protein OSSY52_07230 [Tepiditoga spiralis]|uniref:DUF5780 domain-containing protein n=1 Tax=Tepiditoga spiralis TaxID=2108365 RepID=A0A7G1G933_9BACT|nr:DUF5780 domain-containing protein [Tepiditoga spiralis]BBE30582.1 hypothetical protein OSSY52_07230 [Tepiditoga spiralis]
MKKAVLVVLLLSSFLLVSCTKPLDKTLSNPSPLKIIGTKVSSETIYGITQKKFQVFVENISSKTIIAYKVDIKGYNSFDEQVTIDFVDTLKGIVQNINIKPSETYGYKTYWSSVYAGTVKYIKTEIVEVKFDDGTTWIK